MATGTSLTAIRTMVAARITSGAKRRVRPPSWMSRSTNGRTPSCCRAPGRVFSPACSTSTSPARKATSLSLSMMRAPLRPTAMRLTPYCGCSRTRAAERPTSTESRWTTASIERVSSRASSFSTALSARAWTSGVRWKTAFSRAWVPSSTNRSPGLSLRVLRGLAWRRPPQIKAAALTSSPSSLRSPRLASAGGQSSGTAASVA